MATPALTVRAEGRLPALDGATGWLNSEPLTPEGLRGRVVLVDFWTYTCINCLRTLPYLKAWDARYRGQGLTIVGVHTPEFAFERKPSNVGAAIGRQGIRYPVVQDNEYGTWNAFGNQYWPAKYLIDAKGRVRYVHFGEGEYEETETAIRELLAEAGEQPGKRARAKVETASPGVTTPERYLGSLRADRFANVLIRPGNQRFELPAGNLPEEGLAYGGRWRISPDAATAVAGSKLELNFGARRVFLVLGSAGEAVRSVRVRLDGKRLPTRYAGSDVRDGIAQVSSQRLYRLVELPQAERHLLTLDLAPGVSGYAFTFG